MGREKKGRRARGTGSLFWSETRGCWVGRAEVDGKRVERSARTQGEVLRKLAALKPAEGRGGDTLAAWAAVWLAGLGTRRPRTREQYGYLMTRLILPVLGARPLAAITPYEVERAATAVVASGRGAGTARQAVGALRICLRAAVKAGKLATNPAALATTQRPKRREIDPLPPADVSRVIAAASADPKTHALALAAAAGLRIGELVALDVADWDGTRIAVTRAETHGHGIGPPKSPHSVRTITVPVEARAAVAAAAGDRKDGPLFANPDGSRPNRGTHQKRWKALLGRLGIRYRNLHQCRHSVASTLIAGGAGVADVAKYLGDTVAVVVRTYLHPTQADPSGVLDRQYAGG